MATHTQDTDCTVDRVTQLCTGCGVYHGDECHECGGHGFHKLGFSQIDACGCGHCEECMDRLIDDAPLAEADFFVDFEPVSEAA